MARLEHANALPVFDVGTTGDNVYLVMPYMAGGTLGRWLADERRPWRAVLARFVAAGRGLAAAHRQGIIHRDFKPDNVLLGADDEVRVADFGLAAFAAHPTPLPDGTPSPAVASHLTRTGTVLGTPIYMAPEQLCGKPIDARSDQFSFCVGLWEGLYGERPFRPGKPDTDSELEGLLGAIRRGPPAPAQDRGVPRWLRALVARGLRPDPAERWPSLDDLLARAVARQRRPLKIAAALGVGLAAAAVIAGAAAVSGAGESASLGPDAASPAPDGAAARAFRISRITVARAHLRRRGQRRRRTRGLGGRGGDRDPVGARRFGAASGAARRAGRHAGLRAGRGATCRDQPARPHTHRARAQRRRRPRRRGRLAASELRRTGHAGLRPSRHHARAAPARLDAGEPQLRAAGLRELGPRSHHRRSRRGAAGGRARRRPARAHPGRRRLQEAGRAAHRRLAGRRRGLR